MLKENQSQPLLFSDNPNLLLHIGVIMGKYQTESSQAMTLQNSHRKNTIYFVNNSHGNDDVWKIRMFIPNNKNFRNIINEVILRFELGNTTLSSLFSSSSHLPQCIGRSMSEDEDFIIVEYKYSNPRKTKKKPHTLMIQYLDKVTKKIEEHSLFSFYVFSHLCTDSLYLADFWHLFVPVTFLFI